jgi:cytochrome c6
MIRPVRAGLSPALVILALLWSAPMFADGAALYKTKCQPCHGADGSGNTPVGKSLHVKALGSDEVQKLSDADLTKIIHDGKNKMPAFAGKLSDDELRQVVAFIRSFAPQK